MKEDNDKEFDHAWKYFELHSQQRMTVFNFYITIIGLLTAGCGVSLQQGGGFIYFSTAIGLFITFISLIFYKLDDRVSKLIKLSEEALAHIEKKMDDELRIFSSEKNSTGDSKGLLKTWTYGQCFRLAFYILANAGVILSLVPFIIDLKNK